MKTLNRLFIGSITESDPKNKKEEGGTTGCCWDVMAEAYRRMYASEYAQSEYKNSPYFTPSYYQTQWGNYMGSEAHGDPDVSQSQYLYDFMKTYYFSTTTGSSWGSDLDKQLNDSGASNWANERLAFAVMSGGGNNQHAVLVTGKEKEQYKYWDPATKAEHYASKGNFLYSTGISRRP